MNNLGHENRADSVKIAVVIPCYKVKQHILQVLNSIGPEVSQIIVVDDASTDPQWTEY